MHLPLILTLIALSGTQKSESRPEVLRQDLQLRIYPQTGLIKGAATIEITARDGDLSSVRFTLNESLEIDSVIDGEHNRRPRRGNRLGVGRAVTIKLTPPIAVGTSRALTFEYHGKGSAADEDERDWAGLLVVRADEIRLASESQWYPQIPLDDSAHSVLAGLTTLELSLPPGMESLGPGKFVGTSVEDEVVVHNWMSKRALRPSLVAGNYDVQNVRAAGRDIRILSFAGHEEGAKLWAQGVGRAIEDLSMAYGELGYESYSICERRVLNPKNPDRFEASGLSVFDDVQFGGHEVDSMAIAHDVAHLWFGAEFDAYGEAEEFLTESMALAAALVSLEVGEGQAAATEAAKLLSEHYWRDPGKELSVLETNPDAPRHAAVIHAKGVLALRSLRFLSGEEEFDEVLRKLIGSCAQGKTQPTLDSLLEALRSKFGEGVDDWVREWLSRPGAPNYAITYKVEPMGKQTRVSGFLTQKGDLYRTPIEVGVRSSSGRTTYIMIRPRDRRMIYQAVVPHDVAGVEIDPRYHLLFERE
ncbi:MAG: hypothetical protein ACI8X5_001686 [Planctomycetota bacterium]|jgi:hypothetical protein